jgi:hypothetical protein
MSLDELQASIRRVLGTELPLGPPSGEGPHVLRRLIGGSDVTALRELFTELLGYRDTVQHLADLTAGTDIHYDMGTDNAHPLVGRFAPDMELRTPTGTVRLAELTRTARPLLLDLTEDASPAGTLSEWHDQVDIVTANVIGERRCGCTAVQGELIKALAVLSARDRDVLLLIAWADLSYDEVVLLAAGPSPRGDGPGAHPIIGRFAPSAPRLRGWFPLLQTREAVHSVGWKRCSRPSSPERTRSSTAGRSDSLTSSAATTITVRWSNGCGRSCSPMAPGP